MSADSGFLSPGGLSPAVGPGPVYLHLSAQACGEGEPRQPDLLRGQTPQRPPDPPDQRKGGSEMLRAGVSLWLNTGEQNKEKYFILQPRCSASFYVIRPTFFLCFNK